MLVTAQNAKTAPGFLKRQGGNITIFSLFSSALTLLVAGAAIDFMRHEATRVELQATLDRALLAAADLDQQQDAEAVLRDYLARNGFEGTVQLVSADTGLTHRAIEASINIPLQTGLLALSGVEEMQVSARGAAAEKTANIEISMVLDTSDSMDSNNRMINMQAAAQEFVSAVIRPEEANVGLTTVSIVPYNSVVNIGTRLADYYTLSDDHDYSQCITFTDGDFNDTAISRTDPLTRISHFDYTSTNQATTEITDPWCVTGNTNAPIIHSANEAAMHTYIDNLTTTRNTAIHLGVKWGAALLDPSVNGVVSDLVTEGLTPAGAASRPAAFTDTDTIKVMVVMTDGANTTEWDLKPHLKTGLSNIWINDMGNDDPSDDRFSMQITNATTGVTEYYWDAHRTDDLSLRYQSEPDGGAAAVQMTNPEIYARWGIMAIRNKFYQVPWNDRKISYADYFYARFAYDYITKAPQADAWLSEICTAAKQSGILIYSVAFEAEDAGRAALTDCASSASHYFDAAGTEITDVFKSIALQINSLRLTK